MTHVVCLLNVENDRATFTWSEGPASFEPYQLQGGMFDDFIDLAGETRDRLSELVKDYLVDDENLSNSSLALAQAGYELYQQLFDPGAAQGHSARVVRKWLESLRKLKSVDTLEIVVDSPWSLPWNVVYDEEPNREAFLSNDPSVTEHWRPFWAIRYNLTGGRRVSPLRRMPMLHDPHLLMVIDPEIRDGLPPELRQNLRTFIEENQFKAVSSKEELTEAIKQERPDLLYWLSHATPSALVLNDEEISPRQLRRLLRDNSSDESYAFGGVAFLNACQTAESGEGGSFFDALHSVGFAGMVGTEHQTIDTFACPLGLDFLREFLLEGKPLGSIMRRLRARVPLGLLYGTYCPPDLCVERSMEDSHIEIVRTPVMQGAMLGGDTASAKQNLKLPEQPYRSLAYYHGRERALFAGRDDDIERFATLLDDERVRIVVLHGESGVGKTSFLRAGVIPYLEEDSIGYRFVRETMGEPNDDSVLFIRATNDLAGSLAQSLTQLCAKKIQYATPTGESVDVDLPAILLDQVGGANAAPLRDALLNDPGLAAQLICSISEALPFELILVVDQAEEIFTLSQAEDEDNRRLCLAMLSRMAGASGSFKVILSLRTEYYGRLTDGLRRGLFETASIREYLLTDFDVDALVEAIKRPTLRSTGIGDESPFSKYAFQYEHGVAEQIARRVSGFSEQRRDSVLPLMQVVCSQLYERAKQKSPAKITIADFESVGGVEGGVRAHVDSMIDKVFAASSDKRDFKRLLTQLYLRQPDGGLTTALLRKDDVRKRWRGKLDFDQLLTSAVSKRLLRVNTLRIGGLEEQEYVSLGHDALAKLAAAWDDEFSQGARMRKLIGSLVAAGGLVVVLFGLTVYGWSGWRRAESNKKQAESNWKLAEQREQQALTNLELARDNEEVAVAAIEKIVNAVNDNKSGVKELSESVYTESLSQLKDLVENWKKLGDKADENTRQKLARASYWGGRVMVLTGESRKALEYLDEASEIQTDLQNTKLDVTKELSDTLTEIGNARMRIAREGEFVTPDAIANLELAVSSHREAEKLRERLRPKDKRRVASSRMNIGSCLLKLGLVKDPVWGLIENPKEDDTKFAEARRLMSEAQRLRTEAMQAASDELAQINIQFDLAQGYQNLGELERYAKHSKESLEGFQRAKTAFSKVLEKFPYHSDSGEGVCSCDMWIGYQQVWPSTESATKASVEAGIKSLKMAEQRAIEFKREDLQKLVKTFLDPAEKALAGFAEDKNSNEETP